MPDSRHDAFARGTSGRGVGPVVRVLLAFAVLSLLWNVPVRLSEWQLAHFAAASLEVALLLGLLALLPWLRSRASGWGVAIGMAALTLGVVVLKLADFGVRTALGRPLSPWLDLHLAPSLIHLLTGTLGGVLGWLSLFGILALLAAVFALVWATVGMAQRALGTRQARITTLALCATLLAASGIQAVLATPFGGFRPASVHASTTLYEQWQRGRATLAELRGFMQAAAFDPFLDLDREQLLNRLAGTDVLLMFIESYGRSALEDPRYAGTVLPRLDQIEAAVDTRGLHAASAWFTSPTVGGQSWLAHGTLESGLWLPHHRLYELLLTSHRLTLTRAFRLAGHRTIAMKPAINMPWPEGPMLGFERIYAEADMGYAGLPYNWVTMPDQYTLAVLEREERHGEAGSIFAEVSLISSHAPWVPIPPVLDDWTEIGDGEVFSRWAQDGDPPAVVWSDPERVRHQYTLAIDYVLGVLGSYAAEFVNERTLLILVGDHQPSPLITGEGASHDVPMHVIAGDPELIRPFLEWGFAPGMHPDPAAPVRRMDAFRDWFLDAFSDPELRAASLGP